MSVYPVSEPYPSCDPLVDSTFGLYLGALASNPVTTVNGTYYWNTTLNIFRVWDDVQWNDVTPEQFDGIVDGGTVTRTDTIKVRGDTATNWSIANPILLIREIGLETDTKYFKFGDGVTAWNSLGYPTIPSTRVTGFENVDNTSDTDKPVSTQQATADALVLTTANTYTDDTVIGLFRDMGSYDPAITNQFPTGTILQGYTYIYSNTGIQGSVTVSSGDQVRAKIDNPGQTEANWLITPKFDSSTKPYIVSASPVYGRPIANSICVSHEFVLPVVFPANLTGSKALVKATKKATNTAIFEIKKNDIQIGTVTFTNASTIGAFSFDNSITFNIGDVLDIYAPSPADPTLADIIISLYGTR